MCSDESEARGKSKESSCPNLASNTTRLMPLKAQPKPSARDGEKKKPQVLSRPRLHQWIPSTRETNKAHSNPSQAHRLIILHDISLSHQAFVPTTRSSQATIQSVNPQAGPDDHTRASPSNFLGRPKRRHPATPNALFAYWTGGLESESIASSLKSHH